MLITNPKYMKRIGPWYTYIMWKNIPYNIWKIIQLRLGGLKPIWCPLIDGRHWIDAEIKYCNKCKRYCIIEDRRCRECKHVI